MSARCCNVHLLGCTPQVKLSELYIAAMLVHQESLHVSQLGLNRSHDPGSKDLAIMLIRDWTRGRSQI